MKRPRKTMRVQEDLLDISQYWLKVDAQAQSVAAQSFETEASVEIQHEQMRTHTPEGKDALNKLILQDIASQSPVLETKAPLHRKKAAAQRPRASRQHQPSSHVVDLRKHYLIEKYALHTIERPKESWLRKIAQSSVFHRHTMQWHIPETLSARTVVTTAPEPESIDIPTVGFRASVPSFAGFAVILLLLLAPLPALRTVQKLLVAKGDFMATTKAAFGTLQAGVESITESEYTVAEQQLADAASNFNKLTETLQAYQSEAYAIANVVPGVQARITLAREAVRIGTNTAEIGSILSEGLQTLDEQRTAGDTFKRLAVRFSDIADSLTTLDDALQDIHPGDVPEQLRASLSFMQKNHASLVDSSRRIAALAELVHHIGGGDAYSRYLFLFQNNRELRPTGGFIGSFALADFSRGGLTGLEFPGGGSYDVAGGFKQKLIPPEPLSILNSDWHMWDGNWWPDFPTSARKVAWFYEASGGPSVNGVIAINATVMQALLRITGPIELPEYAVTVSDANFFDVIQNEVELTYDKDLNQPKKILKDLLPLVLERTRQTADYRQLFALLASSLRSKDIQVAVFDDPEQATAVRTMGWDGSLKTSVKDYLAVISTNIAGGKSDASIFDTITHDAAIQENGDIEVTVRMKREHRADPKDVFAYVNHVDYVRFYVPMGATLIDAQGFQRPDDHYFRTSDEGHRRDSTLDEVSGQQSVDVATGVTMNTELNHTVFGHWLQVEPGQTVEALITYKLPFRIRISARDGVSWLTDWSRIVPGIDTYSLLVQKQSGKQHVMFNSSVKIPNRYRVIWSEAVDARGAGVTKNQFMYSTGLTSDTYYALVVGEQPSP